MIVHFFLIIIFHKQVAWYPDQPSLDDQRSMVDFFAALARFYPCTWYVLDPVWLLLLWLLLLLPGSRPKRRFIFSLNFLSLELYLPVASRDVDGDRT
jgi:hypothetical protein